MAKQLFGKRLVEFGQAGKTVGNRQHRAVAKLAQSLKCLCLRHPSGQRQSHHPGGEQPGMASPLGNQITSEIDDLLRLSASEQNCRKPLASVLVVRIERQRADQGRLRLTHAEPGLGLAHFRQRCRTGCIAFSLFVHRFGKLQDFAVARTGLDRKVGKQQHHGFAKAAITGRFEQFDHCIKRIGQVQQSGKAGAHQCAVGVTCQRLSGQQQFLLSVESLGSFHLQIELRRHGLAPCLWFAASLVQSAMLHRCDQGKRST